MLQTELPWRARRFCGIFLFYRKLRSLWNKTLRGMRARAKWKFAAEAAALGARVPQTELFVTVGIISCLSMDPML